MPQSFCDGPRSFLLSVPFGHLLKEQSNAMMLQLCAPLFDSGEHKVWKLEINDSAEDIKNLFHVNFNNAAIVSPQ